LFLGHNLLAANAKKPGSKNEDFRPIFFKGKHKVPSCDWGSGPDEVGQKDLNLPLLWRNPQKYSSPKLPGCF